MHRPNADPGHMQATDFLCDFCERCWATDRPMIEGHHGSLICGACLSVAYASVVIGAGDAAALEGPGGASAEALPEELACTMCLEQRSDSLWQSPARDVARICRRCIELGARTLERDRESGWKRPT